MPFHSILFDRPSPGAGAEDRSAGTASPDLNLDQVVAAVVSGREEYGLEALFSDRGRCEPECVEYRQEVMRDLTPERARQAVNGVLRGHAGRAARHLAGRSVPDDGAQAERWFLDAAAAYCRAVVSLREPAGSR